MLLVPAIFIIGYGSQHAMADLVPTNMTMVSSQSVGHAGDTFTINVRLNDLSFMPTTPSGTVSFSDNYANGRFTPSTCSLYYGNCTTSYTSSADPMQAIRIFASYSGDNTHLGSSSTLQISTIAMDNTMTQVSGSSSFTAGEPISLTVAVIDTNFLNSVISGMITLNDNGAGGSFSSTNCIPIKNECTVEYTPPTNAPEGITINAFYDGDSQHSASSITYSIVNLAPSNTIATNANSLTNGTAGQNCFNQGGSWNAGTDICTYANQTQPAPVQNQSATVPVQTINCPDGITVYAGTPCPATPSTPVQTSAPSSSPSITTQIIGGIENLIGNLFSSIFKR